MTLHTRIPEIGEKTDVRGVTILRSGKAGPSVGLMGMVHGDELSGLALWRLAEEIGRPLIGNIVLIAGHPEAIGHRDGPTRFIERDMNRLFLDHGGAGDGEAGKQQFGPDQTRCRELMPVLAKLDFLIDVHSTSITTTPFAFVNGDHPMAFRMVADLPVSQVYGIDRFIQGTAASWVARHGGTAFTIETGRHDDPRGPGVAFDNAYQLLFQLGMVARPWASILHARPHDQRHIKVVQQVKSVHPGFAYARDMTNFARLDPGELIGFDEEAHYRAPEIDHAVIVMPAAVETLRAGKNPDAFFIGIELDFLPNILDQVAPVPCPPGAGAEGRHGDHSSRRRFIPTPHLTRSRHPAFE